MYTDAGVVRQVHFNNVSKGYSFRVSVIEAMNRVNFVHSTLMDHKCVGRHWRTRLLQSWRQQTTCVGLSTLDGFDFYIGHHNLIFLFAQLAVVPDLYISSTWKFLRLDVRLSIYKYTCVHIKVLENVWTDVICRWSQLPTMRRLVEILELPSSHAHGFEWPNSTDIEKEQAEHNDVDPTWI